MAFCVEIGYGNRHGAVPDRSLDGGFERAVTNSVQHRHGIGFGVCNN